MEALFSSEAVTPNYRIAWHKIAEHSNTSHHHVQTLKKHKSAILSMKFPKRTGLGINDLG
jgi:hypothetical protein